LIGHIKPNQKPKGETTAIVSLPDPDADWRKLISEYLRLGAILDDETKTTSYIITTPQASFSDASPMKKASHCSLMSTRVSVGIKLHRRAWTGRLYDRDFTS
jgi:hypothetical protein